MDNIFMPYDDWWFIGEMVNKSHWIFAKSMPQNPHYYMLRKKSNDDEFVHFVLLIRKYGFRMKYGKSWYICLRVNEWYYWTMGCPIHNDPKTGTILINRKECRLGIDSPYDQIAVEYDSNFCDDFSSDENIQIAALISRHNLSGKTLEIGCGSGSVTRELMLNCDNYLGIDPSWAMLKKFHSETRIFKFRTIHTDFEGFATSEKFNFIFATYGAASYVRPEFWRRLDKLLQHSGTFFMMFYADEYTPITHILSQNEIPYYLVSEFSSNCSIPFKTTQIGNYIICEGINK